MQYLLTQKEMDDLMAVKRVLEQLPKIEKLQEVCSSIADKMVLTEGWAKGRPWGCILTTSPSNYCDQCPVREICPHPSKKWSK